MLVNQPYHSSDSSAFLLLFKIKSSFSCYNYSQYSIRVFSVSDSFTSPLPLPMLYRGHHFIFSILLLYPSPFWVSSILRPFSL